MMMMVVVVVVIGRGRGVVISSATSIVWIAAVVVSGVLGVVFVITVLITRVATASNGGSGLGVDAVARAVD